MYFYAPLNKHIIACSLLPVKERKLWEFHDFVLYAIGHERNLAEKIGYPTSTPYEHTRLKNTGNSTRKLSF
jgi:hypothetical protein